MEDWTCSSRISSLFLIRLELSDPVFCAIFLFQTSIQVMAPASGVIEEILVPDGERVVPGMELLKLRVTGQYRAEGVVVVVGTAAVLRSWGKMVAGMELVKLMVTGQCRTGHGSNGWNSSSLEILILDG